MTDRQIAPSILRRSIAMFYELLLLAAVLIFFLVVPHVLLGAFAGIKASSVALKIHALLLMLLYFVWFWTHGGQTLAMKTWRIRLTDKSGARLRPAQAVLRYLAAWPSILLGGVGIWWAFFDRDGQFLHDRIADSRLWLDRPAAAAPRQDQP